MTADEILLEEILEVDKGNEPLKELMLQISEWVSHEELQNAKKLIATNHECICKAKEWTHNGEHSNLPRLLSTTLKFRLLVVSKLLDSIKYLLEEGLCPKPTLKELTDRLRNLANVYSNDSKARNE